MNIPNLSQIFMNFPITARTACKELEELCKKGVIEKKGKGPAVYSLGLLAGLS
jgi:predicted transcriptional regulator